ncbi:MAG: DNA-binding domain-containing protein, partial [Promethearchaeota archaeon]
IIESFNEYEIISNNNSGNYLTHKFPNCVTISKEKIQKGVSKGVSSDFKYINTEKTIIYIDKEYYLTKEKVFPLISIKYLKNIHKKAKRESWEYIQIKGNGGLKKYYKLDSLPRDAIFKFYSGIGNIHDDANCQNGRVIKDVDFGHYASASAKERYHADLVEQSLREWQDFIVNKKKTKGTTDFIKIWNISRGKELRITKGTLYRQYQIYKSEGKDGLIRKWNNKNKGNANFDIAAKEYLCSIYFTEDHRDLRHCYQNLKWIAREKEWVIPSESAAYRFIQQFPADFVARTRGGRKAFDDYGYPSIFRDKDGLNPGELYVADGRIIDVSFGVGKKGMRLKVAPWMDVATGKFLSVQYPDNFNVQAVLDGLYAADQIHISDHILVDNGSDYRKAGYSNQWKSNAVKTIDNDLLSPMEQIHGRGNVHFAIIENAKAKYIERKFRDMARVCDKSFYNGYTAELLQKRPDKWSFSQKAGKFPSRDELIRQVDHYFFQIANNWAPDGKKSPNEMWAEYWQTHDKKRMSDTNLRHLLLPMTKSTYKVIRGLIKFGKSGKDRYGKKLYRYYGDDWMTRLPAGTEYYIKYNTNDHSKIWLYDKKGALVSEVKEYKYSKVSYLHGGDDVSSYMEDKRHREKEILQQKADMDARVNEMIKIEPILLMQRADIHKEPRDVFDSETGELLERVEYIDADLGIEIQDNHEKHEKTQKGSEEESIIDKITIGEKVKKENASAIWDRFDEKVKN